MVAEAKIDFKRSTIPPSLMQVLGCGKEQPLGATAEFQSTGRDRVSVAAGKECGGSNCATEINYVCSFRICEIY